MRAATLDFLLRHRRTRLEPLTQRLVDRIEAGNPGYRESGLVPHDDLVRSCRDNVARVLTMLADAARVRSLHAGVDDDVLAPARETGHRRAEQGLPLDDVLRSFRIGGALIWEDLVDQGGPALDAQELREIGTRLWVVVDETSAAVAQAYHQHERALVRADEQQRAELWEGVLGGRAREPGFAHDAALLLDVPVDGDFLVVVAEHLDPRRAAAVLAPHATAWVRRADGVVGLLALRGPDPDDALAGLREVAAAGGAALGVSTTVHGLAAVDEGLRRASLALRAQGETPGLAALDDRLPEALLLRCPDLATLLLDRWVRPLRALPPSETRALLQTLAAWVAHAGSATGAAAAVPCHRNTVVNRLNRVAELCGVAVDGGVLTEVDLALRAERMGLPTSP
ncbi:helix-turn-helix domain-containing protein [Nocardioides marinquilinus]|uniref:Helix-turn-helix domain-containing protein n=1 Tax=Nocardioides marinquilinus TaxID=1210400 RepID=A0ABP9P9Y0_9ACTN